MINNLFTEEELKKIELIEANIEKYKNDPIEKQRLLTLKEKIEKLNQINIDERNFYGTKFMSRFAFTLGFVFSAIFMVLYEINIMRDKAEYNQNISQTYSLISVFLIISALFFIIHFFMKRKMNSVGLDDIQCSNFDCYYVKFLSNENGNFHIKKIMDDKKLFDNYENQEDKFFGIQDVINKTL